MDPTEALARDSCALFGAGLGAPPAPAADGMTPVLKETCSSLARILQYEPVGEG